MKWVLPLLPGEPVCEQQSDRLRIRIQDEQGIEVRTPPESAAVSRAFRPLVAGSRRTSPPPLHSGRSLLPTRCTLAREIPAV